MDATTKILLALIAGGLWVQIATATFRPTTANAQDSYSRLTDIASDVGMIARGTCSNKKIC